MGTGGEEARQPCERLGLSGQDGQGGGLLRARKQASTHERSAPSPDSAARALPPAPA